MPDAPRISDARQPLFANRQLRPEAFVPYGFVLCDGFYTLTKPLPGCGLILQLAITLEGQATAKVTDPQTGEPYTLHLAPGAGGAFIGTVREAYAQALEDVANHCFVPHAFQTEYACNLLDYVRHTHGDEMEFLWEKQLPGNGIWRRRDTGKWYGLLLKVKPTSLGLATSSKNRGKKAAPAESEPPLLEILDVRIAPDELPAALGRPGFLPGYHMNKKNWVTLLLDGTVPLETLYALLEGSYCLAVK